MAGGRRGGNGDVIDFDAAVAVAASVAASVFARAFASLVLLFLDDFIKAQPRQSCSSSIGVSHCSRSARKNDGGGGTTG